MAQETTMRAGMRNLIEKARQLSGRGAVRNARQEVDDTRLAVVDLDHRLKGVCDPGPRRAA
jgi:hypothetical protein